MRNRKLFAAALAFALTIGGFVLSAQALDIDANMDVSLKDNLTNAANSQGKVFGYMKKNGEFHSLASAMSEATVQSDGKAHFSLGNFTVTGNTLRFGYAAADGANFTDAPVKLSADPLYSYTYDSQNFYTLDFPNESFDGSIEIVTVGSPLPASTVTLIVALGAAAAMLLYFNRRKQVRISEQA